MEHERIKPPAPIWEGSIGATFNVRKNSQTGDHFITFELVRRAKNDETGVWSYPHDFSERNAEALGIVISQALRLISQTDANLWAKSQRQAA